MEAATSVMFQGFTRIAPAPRDCAAPANCKTNATQTHVVCHILNKNFIKLESTSYYFTENEDPLFGLLASNKLITDKIHPISQRCDKCNI